MSDSPSPTAVEATPPAAEGLDRYENMMRYMAEARHRAAHGQVVIKGRDLPWLSYRQGVARLYLHYDDPPGMYPAIPPGRWIVFIHDIRQHSGEHVHQGGLGLYVLSGKGHTHVNGARYAWREGDLVLLPIVPEGCVHQHFNDNDDPTESSKWLAMVYMPFFDVTGSQFEQRETHADWRD